MMTMLKVLLCFTAWVCHCHGAERVAVKSLLQQELHRRQKRSDPVTSYRFKRHADVIPMTEMNDVMELEREAGLEVVQETMTVQGTKVVKLQERYKGRVIPDAVLTLETDHEGRHVLDASGNVYKHIDLDFEKSSHLTSDKAKTQCIKHNYDEALADYISHVKVEEEVLFDNNQPYPVYLVQYLVSPVNEEERRPTCLIDARDSRVLVSWDAIDTCLDCGAKGVGGNLKIGKIRYGELQRCLDLKREDDTCYLENKYVRVLNNKFTYNLTDDEGDNHAEVGSYNCEEIDDYVNGGYSPLLDALFYGTVVAKMFENWYDMSPLGDTMIFRVHFGANFSNAFWNGYECSYGDGNGVYFHPLVSLDIVGHEIAHGITEKNSNLYYYQQWGGINEAFSDMTGETAESYLEEADWVMGLDITAGDIPPIRYFGDPEKDNFSISHVENYTEFLDPHFGSGVYNHVFYALVHEYRLPIREVYGVFLHANRMYWHHMSDYVHAACDVMKAAYDLGQDGNKFRKAFEDVGIEVCDVEDHVLGLKHKHLYKDIKVSRAVSPTFVFAVPGEFAESVTVNSSSPSGDVYIILSDKKWGFNQDHVQVYAEGLHSVTYELPDNVTTYVTISLITDSNIPLKDVTLVAAYNCIANFTPEMTYRSYVLYYHWLENCGKKEDEEVPDDQESSEEDEESKDEEEDEEDKEKEDKENKENDSGLKEDDKLPVQKTSFGGHVFNFFHPFIVMIFPQSK